MITQQDIQDIIDRSFKSEIKGFPDFDYLVEEIVNYINKYSVKEDYFEDLIEFFSGKKYTKILWKYGRVSFRKQIYV